MSRLLVIDGMNLLYHARYKPNDPDIQPRMFAASFMAHLGRVLYLHQPSQIIVAWDSGLDPRRLAIFPEYKAARAVRRAGEDEQGQAVRKQRIEDMKLLQNELLPLLGVDQVRGIGQVEADDLILWSLTTFLETGKYRAATILSGDSDLYQLLTPACPGGNNSPAITQLSPASIFKSAPAHEISIDGIRLKKETGWWPSEHVWCKAVIGDTSDSIPGVRGIGIESVKKAVAKMGSVAAIMARPQEAKKIPRMAALFERPSLEIVSRNMQIITLMMPERDPFLNPGIVVTGMQAMKHLGHVSDRLAELGIQVAKEEYRRDWLVRIADYMEQKARLV